jgi:acyl carrier protein
MTEASHAPDSEVTAVVERFQQYLGTTDELPLESLLLADLGVDSIALVTILLDLAEQLELDLASADVNLHTVQTLGDVVSLVASLHG